MLLIFDLIIYTVCIFSYIANILCLLLILDFIIDTVCVHCIADILFRVQERVWLAFCKIGYEASTWVQTQGLYNQIMEKNYEECKILFNWNESRAVGQGQLISSLFCRTA